jgi:hypothetical protein
MGGTEAIRRWVPTTQTPFSIDDVIAALPERVGSTARDPAMRRLEAARVALIELRQEGAIAPAGNDTWRATEHARRNR